MRHSVPFAAVAAALAFVAPAPALATITTSAVPVGIDPTLQANGWSGWYIQLNADAASQFRISVIDLKNDPLILGAASSVSTARSTSNGSSARGATSASPPPLPPPRAWADRSASGATASS
jgi:hypothetical protein